MTNLEEVQRENLFLEFTKGEIKKEIASSKKMIVDAPSIYKHRYSDVGQGDEDLLETMVDMLAKRVVKLERVIDNPYFAKIKFWQNGSEKPIEVYISKTNIVDEHKNTIAVDWRSPICSLYYDQRMGKMTYSAPSGSISGELLAKKQILIEDGVIVDIIDSETATIDDILLKYLSNNADDRMKSIVASIQAEQNEIIRQPLAKNIIIQGVAGSGKTTVALHRIAYLIYNNIEKYKPEQFCVIGPNKYFMNYISSLLPDLDAEDVNQLTFEELTKRILGSDIKIKDQSEVLSSYNYGNKINPYFKLKCSWDYKVAIENYWNDLLDEICRGGINVGGVEILSEKEVRSRIMENKLPLDENIKNFVSFITRRIKNMQETIFKQIKASFSEQLLNMDVRDPKRFEILSYLDDLKEKLKKGCAKEIKQRFKRFTKDPIKLYKDFITNIDKYLEDVDKNILYQFKKETLKLISKKEFDYEDMPALMYLNILANGKNYGEDMVHVVIDEAQDFGIFHFYIFKLLFPNASFSTFGDMTQSLYSYRSLDSWDDLQKMVFSDETFSTEIMHMQKSYRNTSEIVDNANNVSTHLGMPAAIPVIRHGEEVKYYQLPENDQLAIVELLLEYINKGYKSKAIICKTEEEVDKIYKMVSEWGIPITKITSKDTDYTGGNCVLTGYLAKGLEFDAVILSNASEDNYDSNFDIDMKQLYVSLTRSLHECSVCYTGELTKPLKYAIFYDTPKQLIKN